MPYYWAIDDYTEATITPRVYSKVNPLLGVDFARQFHTGRVEATGSFTYGSIFDRNGDAFDDASAFVNPDDAPIGKELRGHLNAKGLFAPTDFWTYGFGLQLTSDDNYLTRYSLDEEVETQGLYEGEFSRNTSQAFIVGLDDNTRLTASSVAFQDRRDRIIEVGNDQFFFAQTDDGALPVIAPRLEAEHYLTDPLFNGRVKASGNLTVLTRDTGSDYTRGTAGLDYSKSWIAPGGIEVKPFANIRADYYDIEPDEDVLPNSESNSFDRTLGQVGVDIRYPFIKAGEAVTWVVEPRVQATRSFGDAKLDEFTDSGAADLIFTEDAGNADLSAALLWQSNKSSGFDFWQEGTRIDVGGSVSADWGQNSSANLFVGQSFSSDEDGQAIDRLSSEDGGFLLGSGLAGSQSDIVGEASLKLGSTFSTQTRLRYNENTSSLTRIDSSAYLGTKWVQGSARYFRLNNASSQLVNTLDAPSEEISGIVQFNITKNWSTSYSVTRDLDENTTRNQAFGLQYKDDCTLIELLYTENRFNNDAILDNSGIGIRVSLLTLGDFGG